MFNRFVSSLPHRRVGFRNLLINQRIKTTLLFPSFLIVFCSLLCHCLRDITVWDSYIFFNKWNLPLSFIFFPLDLDSLFSGFVQFPDRRRVVHLSYFWLVDSLVLTVRGQCSRKNNWKKQLGWKPFRSLLVYFLISCSQTTTANSLPDNEHEKS